MELCVISFTRQGAELSKQVKAFWTQAELYTKWSGGALDEVCYVKEPLSVWTGAQMKNRSALLFIGACGIAVRAIASYVTDKLLDSPVLVMGDDGRYIVPILSGHMGGANALACRLAAGLGAEPVITTATDIHERFAVDLFAKKNHLAIVNREGIAAVSSQLLDGKEVTLAIEPGHFCEEERLPEGVRLVAYEDPLSADIVITTRKEAGEARLLLRPQVYALGMGCKKGKSLGELTAFVERVLKEQDISEQELFALASIDRKAEEPCFIEWSKQKRLPFLTFSAEELLAVSGDFHGSEFVRSQVGVDSVCERSAKKACGESGQLVVFKQAGAGMTIAIAKRDWSVTFDEK